MEENEKNNKKLDEKLITEVEEKICIILEEGITSNNLQMLGELVDIHKDMKNEKYWKMKGEYYENVRKL